MRRKGYQGVDGFLDDLPDLNMPAKKKKNRGPVPGARRPGVVKYVRIRCPECGSDKCPVYDSSHLPVRYHKCASCGNSFKSIEENYKP